MLRESKIVVEIEGFQHFIGADNHKELYKDKNKIKTAGSARIS